MESYYLKCRKNTENIDPKVYASSSGRAMILSKCARFGSKKSRRKRANKYLGIKAPLRKLPILGDILF